MKGKVIEVIVLLQIEQSGENIDEAAFEKYLKKESFEKIYGEEFAYQGRATTGIMNIRAYIFSVFANAFELVGITKSKLMCQIGKNDFEAYQYEKDGEFFKEIRL